jgi:hypothetical protein
LSNFFSRSFFNESEPDIKAFLNPSKFEVNVWISMESNHLYIMRRRIPFHFLFQYYKN